MCEMDKALLLEELLPFTVIFYFKQVDHDFLNFFYMVTNLTLILKGKEFEDKGWSHVF
jgi:hypothetical protein